MSTSPQAFVAKPSGRGNGWGRQQVQGLAPQPQISCASREHAVGVRVCSRSADPTPGLRFEIKCLNALLSEAYRETQASDECTENVRTGIHGPQLEPNR
jgi:hypothetical protein